jgi:hypothetical protein
VLANGPAKNRATSTFTATVAPPAIPVPPGTSSNSSSPDALSPTRNTPSRDDGRGLRHSGSCGLVRRGWVFGGDRTASRRLR